MGEGADGEKIRPDIFCKILEGHGDAPAGRTDHMNVDLETMAGEVAGNIRAGSGAVAFGSGLRIPADAVDDGARICAIDEIPGGTARFTRFIPYHNGPVPRPRLCLDAP